MQVKKCKADGCVNYPTFGMGGYCRLHQKQDPAYERKQKKQQQRNAILRAGAKIRSEFNRKARNKDIDTELEAWFLEGNKIIELRPYCHNCDAFIPFKYYRAAQCHLLPKSIFKSVATHPLNRVICGAGCGCHHKTESVDSIPKMKIYSEIKEKLIQLFPLVKEHHKCLNLLKEMVENN